MDEYNIEIAPAAIRDIDDAFDYIAHRLENPQASFGLTNDIYLGIQDLDTLPERFPVWPREPFKSKGVRSFRVGNFNVFYSVDKRNMLVSVIRVIYNRRNV